MSAHVCVLFCVNSVPRSGHWMVFVVLLSWLSLGSTLVLWYQVPYGMSADNSGIHVIGTHLNLLSCAQSNNADTISSVQACMRLGRNGNHGGWQCCCVSMVLHAEFTSCTSCGLCVVYDGFSQSSVAQI